MTLDVQLSPRRRGNTPGPSPRRTPRLIGIAGYAREGKDTIGSYLVVNYGFECLAFADKLRELAWRIEPTLGRAVEVVGYEELKDKVPYVREFLVRLGAGARDVLGPDVWLDATLPEGRWGLKWQGPPTVVTDVRYRNEAERIRNLGGEVWRVIRRGVAANDEERRSLGEITHDRIVWNDGTLDYLYGVIDAIMGGAG